jgi:dedicator of cytokinesis protein 3
MPTPASTTPSKWKPLSRMGYGIVTYPFRPLPDTQFISAASPAKPTPKRDQGFVPLPPNKVNDIAAQQLSLDLGDEVYVFEQADGWYRGYVVTSVTPPVGLSTPSAAYGSTMKIATEVKGLLEPKVYVGIFPANYVSVKEYVSDALGILTNGDEEDDGYNSADGSIRDSGPITTKKHKREHSVDSSISHKVTSPETPTFPRSSAHRLSLKLKRTLSNGSRKSTRSRTTDKSHKALANLGQRAPPLPALKVGDDTQAGFEEPLVDEVSAALREWHGLLFGIFLSKKYGLFTELSNLIMKLERARRDLLSGLLTKCETVQLRREIVNMLNVGNRMLPGWSI